MNRTIEKNMILTSNLYSEQLEYWKNRLSGAPEITDFLPDYPDGGDTGYLAGKTVRTLPEEVRARMSRACGGSMAGIQVFLLGCLGVMLERYTGSSDLLVGTSAPSGNGEAVLIRLQIDRDTSFQALLGHVHQELRGALRHNKIPAGIINDFLEVDHTERIAAEILLTVGKTDKGPSQPVHAEFSCTVTQQQAAITLYYDRSHLHPDMAGHILENFCHTVSQIMDHTADALPSAEVIAPAEMELLLHGLNDTTRSYDRVMTLSELFAAQCRRTPDQTAILCDGSSVTYRALDCLSNRIAGTLSGHGVKSGDTVGVLAGRTIEMAASLLAAVKLGAAYLPMDPDYPDERLRYMLEDSNAAVVLTVPEHLERLDFAGRVIDLTAASQTEEETAFVHTNPADVAYLLYTSGSTGKPKGVMVEHHAVHNFIEGLSETAGLANGQVMLSLTTICFDIFVLELWLSLAKGLTVVLAADHEQQNPRAFRELICRHRVDIVQATPSRLQMYLVEENHPAIHSLKKIIVGGEALPPKLLGVLADITPAEVYNVYGPTETTVWSTGKKMTPGEEITVGKPIANTQVFLLDSSRQMVPFGGAGELCIAGDGLARGYHNRPELDRERFLRLPWHQASRIYRTGDLARWNHRGELEFIGRADNQVKVRGNRIELDEIDHTVTLFGSVSTCATAVRTDKQGNAVLCTYFSADTPVDISALKVFLAQKLPDYMVPTYLQQLDRLPYTLNGKLDRKALPEPSAWNAEAIRKVVKPETDLEALLLGLFEQVLEQEQISTEDDFFDIGGHSLNVFMLEHECEKLGLAIQSDDIFRWRTVKKIAASLVSQPSGEAVVQPDQVRENLPSEGAVVLDSILPPAPILYRNCFYSSLFPVLGYYGVPVIAYLCDETAGYHSQPLSSGHVFVLRYENDTPPAERLERLGIRMTAVARCHSLPDEIKAQVDSGNPIIVRVDSYYESIRSDTYQKEHWPHALLVYGYDDQKQVFHILEHQHRNSMEYSRMELPYAELVDAYQGFLAHGFLPGEASVYLFEKGNAREDCPEPSVEYRKQVAVGTPVLLDGLEELTQAVLSLQELYRSGGVCKEVETALIENLNDILNIKAVESYKQEQLYGSGSPAAGLAGSLGQEWSQLRDRLFKCSISGRTGRIADELAVIPAAIIPAERQLLCLSPEG